MSGIQTPSVLVLGGLELDSVAAGFRVLDAVVKEAPLRVLLVRTVCPGKYVIFVTGSEAAVEAGLYAGQTIAGDRLIDRLYLSNAHPGLWPTVAEEPSRAAEIGADVLGVALRAPSDAVGILESYGVLAAVGAADAAVKAAGVHLLCLRWGDEMGGKASVKLTGPIYELEPAVAAGERVLQEHGCLCTQIIVPRPDPAIARLVENG